MGGDVQVAAFNVLNYFNGDGRAAASRHPRRRTPPEFDRQRAKIVSAISALDADVVGLMELENDDPTTEYSAVEDLVDGLDRGPRHRHLRLHRHRGRGHRRVRVGILYQPAS